MSADEQNLLIVAVLFIAAVGIFALSMHLRGRALLHNLREGIDADLWAALGAPESLLQALRDPEGRWRRFIRSGEYRCRLTPELAEQIDDYRHRGNRMLVIFGIAALLLLIRFWPLLKPAFL